VQFSQVEKKEQVRYLKGRPDFHCAIPGNSYPAFMQDESAAFQWQESAIKMCIHPSFPIPLLFNIFIFHL